MSAPISLNSGRNQALEGALIWRTEGLHYFYPGLPPENHSANAQEKGGSLFWTPTATHTLVKLGELSDRVVRGEPSSSSALVSY